MQRQQPLLRDDVEAWVDFQARTTQRAAAAADLVLIVAIWALGAWFLFEYFEPCAAGSLCMAVVGMPRRRGRRALTIERFARPGLIERLCRSYVRWCEQGNMSRARHRGRLEVLCRRYAARCERRRYPVYAVSAGYSGPGVDIDAPHLTRLKGRAEAAAAKKGTL